MVQALSLLFAVFGAAGAGQALTTGNTSQALAFAALAGFGAHGLLAAIVRAIRSA